MLRKHQRTECNEDSYLVILHLSRVELHCKLQEKLHRVTWPLRLLHMMNVSFSLLNMAQRILGVTLPNFQ